ncbi:MAG: FkbM family methyltransferase [Bacteroidetes bacterium]|nr:FkbM family methyltransferase [Bacteroidota bacterium]
MAENEIEAKSVAEGHVDQIVQKRFFPTKGKSGVLVEIGAARPDFLSIGSYYRQIKWRVVSIEPNPDFYVLHQQQGNEIYAFACGDRDEDDVDFIVVDSHRTKYEDGEVSFESYSSLGIKDSFAKLNDHLDKRTIKVRLRRLSTLFESEIPGITEIDILAVDVEGWELEVLSGLDSKKHRPRVMILENLFNEEKYRSHLRTLGYRFWRRLYPNDVYVDDEFVGAGFQRLGFYAECLWFSLTGPSK